MAPTRPLERPMAPTRPLGRPMAPRLCIVGLLTLGNRVVMAQETARVTAPHRSLLRNTPSRLWRNGVANTPPRLNKNKNPLSLRCLIGQWNLIASRTTLPPYWTVLKVRHIQDNGPVMSVTRYKHNGITIGGVASAGRAGDVSATQTRRAVRAEAGMRQLGITGVLP